MVVHTRPSSEVFDNINNVFGLAKSMSTTGTVTYLGKFNKLDECEHACFKYSSGGAKCTGYTWHRLDFGDHRWARQCFAVLDGRWSPVRQQGAVSGRVVRESNGMQDASGRGCLSACSGHGVCQNTTGVCICDIGFSGFDCSLELGCDSPAVEGRCYTVFERKTSWHKAFDRCANGRVPQKSPETAKRALQRAPNKVPLRAALTRLVWQVREGRRGPGDGILAGPASRARERAGRLCEFVDRSI
jgi:hypothetical protein